MQQQQRFILALVASAAVLIFWNYFFPAAKQPQPNANANAQQTASASPQTSVQPTATVTPTPSQLAQSASPSPTPDKIPQRKVRVVTPLYEVTFDTRGAVVTSWIIKKQKNTGRPMYAWSATNNAD